MCYTIEMGEEIMGLWMGGSGGAAARRLGVIGDGFEGGCQAPSADDGIEDWGYP